MTAILFSRMLKCPKTIWQTYKKEHILGTMMTNRNIMPAKYDILSFLIATLKKKETGDIIGYSN